MPEHQPLDKGCCKGVVSRKHLKERFIKKCADAGKGFTDNTPWELVHSSNLSESNWMKNLEREAVKGDGQMLHYLGGRCMVEA